jgi:NAD(P)-dependent dehydrogenase (short-subunit alcohol dehydrogenase family)
MAPSRTRVAISGAAGGIGGATAKRFHRAGADLVLIDLDEDAVRSLADELGPGTRWLVCDQRQPSAIEQTAEAIGAVDVFVNNAGVIARKPLLEMTTAETTDLLAVNMTGSILMATGIARRMAARGSGVIVNLSSQHAFIGAKDRGIYAASKAAVSQFTRTAAVEWAPHGVRVVAIAPGPVVSPMTADAMKSEAYRKAVLERMPIGRFLETDEIAEIIFQLAQPTMAAVVGQTIIADGGASLS